MIGIAWLRRYFSCFLGFLPAMRAAFSATCCLPTASWVGLLHASHACCVHRCMLEHASSDSTQRMHGMFSRKAQPMQGEQAIFHAGKDKANSQLHDRQKHQLLLSACG